MSKARPRPSKRRHTTFAFRVGEYKVHMSLGRYPDGDVMELWIDTHQEGSTIRALLDAVARLVSRSWQHGVPAAEIVDQFVDTKFPPAGIGSGHPAIEGRRCESLLDAIGRIIAHEEGLAGHAEKTVL